MQGFAKVELLTEQNIGMLSSFSCGEAVLDDWLHNTSLKDVRSGGCQVHICLKEDALPVAFFSLSMTSILPAGLSRSLQGGIHGQIPAILLGKMGVDAIHHGRGYGGAALQEAKRCAHEACKYAGARLLAVDALNPGLVPWYKKRGFTPLPGNEQRLVCKMSAIREAMSF